MLDRIQPLELGDLPACQALARDRDWPPEERKWRLLLTVGTVYGMRDDAGDLIGTAAVTRQGAALAAIGMVLVAARYERRGIGRRLMTRALRDAGEATAFLYATEYGRPLYEKLGFVSAGVTRACVGELAAPPANGSRPARPDDLPALAELDARVNGADRTALMRRLPGFTERLRVLERRGRLTGYASAWHGDGDLVVGPVVAGDTEDAETLIRDTAEPRPIRLDLGDRHPELLDWAVRHGVEPRASSTFMVRGGRPLPGDRDRWFIPLTQALG